MAEDEPAPETDVLIVGAGPTGLVLALWLTGFGVRIRIIDIAGEPGTTSRALAVQARTLELYRQQDLADAVISRGRKVPGVNFWVRGRRRARLPFETIGDDMTPYAFLEIFPQDEHERLLIERLSTRGVDVERGTGLAGFSQDGEQVRATLRDPHASESICTARFIIGCDGARSVVRHIVGADFPGGTYQQLFYVADVEASGAAINGELHVDLDEADFLAIFALAGKGRARLIGTVRDERAALGDRLTFEDVSSRAIRNLEIEVHKVNWFSTYHVHHRVTDRFRQGRAFLVGDAAHIHSPAGGQGMNTGIGDAINLAWKLAAVIAGRAPDALLDSYEAERIGFARRLVATTDRAFSIATSTGFWADFLRTRVAPVVIPLAASVARVRGFAFRTISQINLNYRGGPLSRGVAGRIQGGDRLPWVPADGTDNFAPLASARWQAHVYGVAPPQLSGWCEAFGLPLHVFAWGPPHQAAGLARDALYLLRPDSYVALADPAPSPDVLESYFSDHGLHP